jgi:hypothetical protein
MKPLKIGFVVFIFTSLAVQAQEKQENTKYGISLSGFVKTDLFYDSRQVVSIREGHFLLYPENKKPDLNGKDINSKDRFSILSIQTRLTGKITGPDILKAKSSALIEADFFGNENLNFSDVNGLRLRHALIKLNWSTTELLVGQYWHPLFIPECFPDVVSFNTGAPFQPFSRNPQIRLTQKINNFKLIITASEQRDFLSNGPDGASPKYLSNAVLPDMNIHVQYSHLWDDTNEFLFGIGAEYKMLTPRLYSQADKNLKDGKDSIYFSGNDYVKSTSISFYSKLMMKKFTLKTYGIYGGNLYDQTMLGGYVVKSLNESDQWNYEYTPVKNLTFWAELTTNGKNQAGIFAGYSKNMGTKGDNLGIYYSRGANINYVYRVAPRLIINLEKIRIATELEYTSAQYGDTDSGGIVSSNLKTVSNLRLLLAFYHFF